MWSSAPDCGRWLEAQFHCLLAAYLFTAVQGGRHLACSALSAAAGTLAALRRTIAVPRLAVSVRQALC